VFASLFDWHGTGVHRYLGRRVGERADDLLSDTFLIAFRRRAAYRPERLEVRAWLIGMATKLVHGHVRTEQRWYRALARVAAEPVVHGADPGDSTDRSCRPSSPTGPSTNSRFLRRLRRRRIIEMAEQVTYNP
jgi:DNA-directed RNA polymerase specialized sigma24 family protein